MDSMRSITANLNMAAWLLIATIAQGQEADPRRRGLDIARTNCGGCHAISRNQSSSPDSLAPPFKEVANSSDITDATLKHLMQSAHEKMPPIILTPEEQTLLIAYILSLRSR